MRRTLAAERGQATVEYVAAVLLLAALFALLAVAAGLSVPGSKLAESVARSVVCVVRLGAGCGGGELERELGPELAAALREHAPEIRFEDGEFVSLPVDPRYCRHRRCADSSERGRLDRSYEGEQPTAFVHAIDCRRSAAGSGSCEGERRGSLYLQYWLYYPDSLTRPLGRLGGYHRDDWESFQVRVGPDGAPLARASSHHGHQYGPDAASDAGVELPFGGGRRGGWGSSQGYLWVSAGSHAGRAAGGDGYFRSVPAEDLRLIAIEPHLAELDELSFAVSPPWRKRVWTDPEFAGT